VLHSKELYKCLPQNYEDAIDILMKILGEENPNETGMFSEYYWIMPIGKYVELYGLHDFSISMIAIGEITKRNTGEYAIRPFLKKYPDKTIEILMNWAKSENFHLRRLASEGSRPKLPWSTKLDIFIDNPEPIFNILSILKEDHIRFVQKSVANNITDYLKVNYEAARRLLIEWSTSSNLNTKWIIKYATRKIRI
jgi:3-methyladenine DNA glycosylase AlkC